MTSKELRTLLRSLAGGFGPMLSKSAQQDFERLSDLLEALPEQSVAQLVSTVEKAVLGDPRSPTSLIRRHSDAKGGKPDGSLIPDLKKASTAHLKQVYAAVVGVKPGALKKSELVERLVQELGATAAGPMVDDPAPVRAEVTAAIKVFEAVRDHLREIGFDDIESRLAPLHRLEESSIRAVVETLGFSSARSKQANIARLVEALRGAKSLQQQTDRI